MKKILITILALIGVSAGWLLYEKPIPPFGAGKTQLELAQDCVKANNKVRGCIENLDSLIKANVKSSEISKKLLPATYTNNGFTIEVKSSNVVNGGIEIFASAWDVNGQIGFGSDGTVDVERFVFINPPILVEDSLGDIVLMVKKDGVTNELKERRLREDPEKAILESLVHTIKVSTKNNPRGKIIKDKVGKSTLTVYPDANPESTSTDGHCNNGTSNQAWSTQHDAAACTETDADSTSNNVARLTSNNTSWTTTTRGFFLFDTSALTAGATITAAVFSLYGSYAPVNFHSQTIDIVGSTPASNTEIVIGDYDQTGTTLYSDTTTAFDAFSNGSYNDFTLNATGLSNVSKTGITKFGVRASGDRTNTEPSTGAGEKHTYAGVYFAEQTGTSSDPKLVITYTTASVQIKKQSELFF